MNPDIVDSMQLTPDSASRIVHWTGGYQVKEIDVEDSSISYVGINIRGKNGIFRASQGDYVVRLKDGTFEKMTEQAYLLLTKKVM